MSIAVVHAARASAAWPGATTSVTASNAAIASTVAAYSRLARSA